MTAAILIETTLCPLGCNAGDMLVLESVDPSSDPSGRFAVVRCAACGLMRTNPRPKPESIGRYYPDDYAPYLSSRVIDEPSTVRSRPAWKQFLWSVLHPNNQSIPELPPGRMLEVGCGSGAFLHRMAQNGWHVHGIELSPSAGAEARALGYPVHIGPLETAPDPGERFDLVVGWMVFEHLHDPIGALWKIREWVNPGAWLVLSVPDAGSLEFRLFRQDWFALQLPTHLYHYSPRTLRAVLQKGGWQAERIFWHNNPKNLLRSTRVRLLQRGWASRAGYLEAVADGKRHLGLYLGLGKLLQALRASGRMTVWARVGEVRDDDV